MGKLLKVTCHGHLESLDLKEREPVFRCVASHHCAKPVNIRVLVRWHTVQVGIFFYIELSVLTVQSRCRVTGTLMGLR
jgi:hypothetical protein